jgi:hypothetical protein
MYRRNHCRLVITAVVLAAVAALTRFPAIPANGQDSSPQHVYATEPRDDAAAAEAFAAILPVLRDPRCLNCHSVGDFPRQGDSKKRHAMQVVRGPDGDGVAPVTCAACHLDHNTPGRDAPPGAPDWRMPSPDMPMIWEGLNGAQLCQLFKDPMRNGHRTVDQVVEHMSSPLVLWGWNPGEGRKPVAMLRSQFMKNVTEWAAKGAACTPDK